MDKDHSFQEILEAVCRRPSMYVVGGTYEAAVSFLEGYDGGIARYAPDAEVGFNGFYEWLQKKLSVPRSRLPWMTLREACADDAEALKRLQVLYAEFLVERTASAD